MIRGKGFILALMTAVAAGCASGGGGGAVEGPDTGNRPQDNAHTNSAGVHLMQAGLGEGEEAEAHYQSALTDALNAIQEQPENPKGYLLAGQAAVGLEQWIQADTMFDQATELYPSYADQIASEREQGWVNAYNMGAEALTAGDTETALRHFVGADRLYQDRPEARLALGSLYMRQGDTDKAVAAYQGALEILSGAPPEGMAEEQLAGWAESRRVAAFNAAQLLAQAGRFSEAADLLEGFLADNAEVLDEATALQGETALAGFLAQAGRAEEAEALYEEILSREGLTSNEYFQVGIGFFNTGDYARAAEAFRTAAELNPYSRDALLNLVQSLYSEALELEEGEETAERNQRLHEIYDEILETADAVRDLDPLNRNLLSFMLRAYRAKADLSEAAQAQELTRRTQELFRIYQEQPYEVGDIGFAIQGQGRAELTGTLTNLSGTAGDQIQLSFTVLDEQGQALDQQTITVTAPAQGEAQEFRTQMNVPETGFAGWRYEVVE